MADDRTMVPATDLPPPRRWTAALVAVVGLAWWFVMLVFTVLATCPDDIEENSGSLTKPGTAYGQSFCGEGPERTLVGDGLGLLSLVVIPLAIVAWATVATRRRGSWQAFAMPPAIALVFAVAGKLAMIGAIPR